MSEKNKQSDTNNGFFVAAMHGTKSDTNTNKTLVVLAAIRTVSMVAILIVVLAFVGSIAPALATTLNEAAQASATLNSIATQLEEADLPALVSNVDALIEQSDTAIANAMSSIDEFNIDAMNAAVEELAGATEMITTLDVGTLNEAIKDFSATAGAFAALFGG